MSFIYEYVFSGHFSFPMNTFPLKQRLSGPQLPTQAQKMRLRDTLPLFSQTQAFNLIGHLCYFILQPLRADRQTQREEEDNRYSVLVRCLGDPCGDALISLTAQYITHSLLFQLHFTDQHIQTNSNWGDDPERKPYKCRRDSLSLSDRLILPLGRSYVEQPPSVENPLWEL